jgi:hypothetical protein
LSTAAPIGAPNAGAIVLACAGLGLAVLLPGLVSAAEPAAPAETGRFRASAEIAPLQRSADSRFALEATVRAAPAAASRDGRFVLKALEAPAVDCAGPQDLVFANGFESP